MKALEKDRDRRYETANGLRGGRPAVPGRRAGAGVPAVGGVRLRKFVRRNRGPVVAAGLVLLALVGGVIGTTAGMVRAERAR